MAHSNENAAHICTDAVCQACACFCDDIELTFVGDEIVQTRAACPLGERWFRAPRPLNLPLCEINAKPASLDDGLAAAAQVLAAARRPLFFGLNAATCETQRAALALADHTRALFLAGNQTARAFDSAIRSVGMVSATLGEVRHRADVVLFWGVDPATTHPRHFERYSLNCQGRFVPRGRADRTCIVIDSRHTPTADQADLFLQIAPGSQDAAIAALRAISNGVDPPDDDTLHQQTSVPGADWRALISRLKRARYSAIFFDRATFVANARETSSESLEAFLSLVRDLNRHTHCVALTVGAAGNAAGIEQVLSWQTGRTLAVDFAGNNISTVTCAHSLDEVLSAGHPDAALSVTCDTIDDDWTSLSEAALAHLQKIPLIVLRPPNCPAPRSARAAFTVATPGIHAGGTIFRSDGVPLPLRATISSPYPSAKEVLQGIMQRLLQMPRD